MRLVHLLAHIFVVVAIVALTASGAPPVHAQSEVLTIAAASNLKDAFRKLLPLFEAQNRDVNVRVIYAHPKTLTKQIEEGAPVDVLLAGQVEDIDLLEGKELIIKESKHIYARTALVLITNSAFPALVTSIEELATKPVRHIAIGDPAASAVGKDTIQFLKHRNLESRLKAQLLYGEHSRAVLDLVSKGEAELGVVYRTDAIGSKRVRIIDSAPPDSHRPITYGAVSPWTARNIAGARDFVSFLQTEKAQGELKQYGFDSVDSDISPTQHQEVQP